MGRVDISPSTTVAAQTGAPEAEGVDAVIETAPNEPETLRRLAPKGPETLRRLHARTIEKFPNYIDLRDDKRGNIQSIRHPLLEVSTRTVGLIEQYPNVLKSFFDYLERCPRNLYCKLNKNGRHSHDDQPNNILELKGFPSVYIYPQLLEPMLERLVAPKKEPDG